MQLSWVERFLGKSRQAMGVCAQQVGTGVNPVTPAVPNPTDPTAGGGPNLSVNTGTTSGSGSSSQTGSAATSGNYSGTSQNIYTPGQQGLQNQVGGAAGTVLGGASDLSAESSQIIPQSMQAYSDYYNRFVAPQAAASGGAGSPAIASNLALGLEQLQAQLTPQIYSTQAGVFSNALGTAENAAYTPTGATNSGTQSSTQDTTGSGNWQSSSNQLSALAQFLNL